MNVLVTGGAGFIGSHIADAFVERGDDVVVLDNLSAGSLNNINPRAHFVQGDITDAQLVRRLFREHRFEIVNHHAAQLDVRKSVADPVFDCTQNIIGTLNLLEAARIEGGVKRFMQASTGGAVYGEQDYFPADEQHPTRPISQYGVAKRSIELYLGCYQALYGIEYVAFRYTNVYGPRQSPNGEAGVVAIFTEKLLSGEEAIINGDGSQTRDYVFVGDVVRAHMLALDQLRGSDILNVSTATETDVNQVYANLSELTTGGRAKPQHGPAKAGEQQRSVCSYEHAHAVLGWEPQVSLLDGLRETVAFFERKHVTK
ncbi:MAG: SDR family NAD(P)-dependent oxidoreductase [Bacteroidota bacterium]|nr:SDR family NAD(P)-dependent oxidoreductase [Bacteroidota bacterium]MDP4234651.1 SDR family NAD(P)-dependent oxidoreductase [Bacteroidota bacterium]MDP4243816.1 SDR family NAD(P)-dependent oxidoreductase [Bacteroidota bacterium]MDP4288593.1 SDR family NAD(P)-dependent oxidoreductase [Bacteroidota bacterium]